MRLLEHMKKTVAVKPAAAAAVYQADDRLYRFDDTQVALIRAVVQPLEENAIAAAWGETQAAQLLLLYDGSETLSEGMGVCVDVLSSAPCDYRIAEMPRRYPGHNECTLAFIPETLRA